MAEHELREHDWRHMPNVAIYTEGNPLFSDALKYCKYVIRPDPSLNWVWNHLWQFGFAWSLFGLVWVQTHSKLTNGMNPPRFHITILWHSIHKCSGGQRNCCPEGSRSYSNLRSRFGGKFAKKWTGCSELVGFLTPIISHYGISIFMLSPCLDCSMVIQYMFNMTYCCKNLQKLIGYYIVPEERI